MAELDRRQTLARIETATARSRIVVLRTMSDRVFLSFFADTAHGRQRLNTESDRLIGVFHGRSGAIDAAKKMGAEAE